MRSVMLMFDTLRLDKLPAYCDEVNLPNFKRLEQQTMTFDNFYSASLPCMPARRELHTGYPNFLHRGWGPLEPFDISFIETLKQNNIYTHLITDHQHYWEDGGATYHNRYNSYEFIRGQEGDLYKPAIKIPSYVEELGRYKVAEKNRRNLIIHDEINRSYFVNEEDYPQVKCVNLAIDFLEQHQDSDDWFLQLECFDPHEPFYVPDRFKDMIDENLKYSEFDWPEYSSTRSIKNPNQVKDGEANYRALLLMIDEYLGKILDVFDHYNLWDDTMLIVNTDHGFMFGEKEWSGKSVMPVYDEVAHIPFFLHIPEFAEKCNTRVNMLTQTYDLAPTFYDYFKIEEHPNTFGTSILKFLNDSSIHRTYAICGFFGGHVNIFNETITYMRGSVDPANSPLEEYTLMPTRMRNMFQLEDFKNVNLVKGFSYYNNWQVMRVDSKSYFYNPFINGHMLFDKSIDPHQEHPIDDPEIEILFIDKLRTILNELEAPVSQFTRLGIPTDNRIINLKFIEDERQTRQILRNKIFGILLLKNLSQDLEQIIAELYVNEQFGFLNDLYVLANDFDTILKEDIYKLYEDKYNQNDKIYSIINKAY